MKFNSEVYKQIFGLAAPVILSNVGQIVVTLADNIMVGHLGATALGTVAFSGIVINVFMVIVMGYAVGLSPLVAKKYVRNNTSLCVELFKHSMLSNTILGTAITTILLAILPLMGYLGQPQEVVDSMNGYYIAVSLSIIPYVLFLTYKQLFEGIGNTKVSMIISIVCNILNILFNYILIYGKLGFPALGVTGAGIATLISRCSMPVMFYIYQHSSKFRIYTPKVWRGGYDLRIIRIVLIYSYPISLQMLSEFFSLTAITIMMGWLGVVELAANQITYTMMSLMYFVVNGVASAVTILSAFEFGKKEPKALRQVVNYGIYVALLLMSISSVTLLTLGHQIAALFTTDSAVIPLAAAYMSAICLAQIFDGIQVVQLGALRAIGDVKAAMYIAFFAYTIACVAIAYTLGFIFNLGGVGLWAGFGIGLLLTSIVYRLRFNHQMIQLFSRP